MLPRVWIAKDNTDFATAIRAATPRQLCPIKNMETVYIESTIPSYLTARQVAREPMASPSTVHEGLVES